MPEIQVLDSHVADLIAAGEVVERPASVVKELVENAIDAGATAVTVELQNGGMTFLRVTDNGGGIPPQQVATAFLRHATSKLRTAYDLEAIGTLGFRGEALAAIAAVSRVEILTRQAGQDLGTALTLEGGTVLSQEEAGGPVGTTMLVRNLFFNTPARFKFMKKDSYEGAAALAVVQQQALANPQVSFQCIREGKQVLRTPGDGTLKSAIYAVLGRDVAPGFLPIQWENPEEGVAVSGFVTLPTCCKGSRNHQFFFVNGRYIKSRTLMAAVEEAYKNQKMVGKFPGCVLHITTRLGSVDVNVHPAKTEVKFVSDDKMFRGVYHGVKSALEGNTTRPNLAAALEKTAIHDEVTTQQIPMVMPTPQRVIAPPMVEKPAAPVAPVAPAQRVAPTAAPVASPQRVVPAAQEETRHFRAPLVGASGRLEVGDFTRPTPKAPAPPVTKPVIQPARQPAPVVVKTPVVEPPVAEVPVVEVPAQAAEPWQVKGELFNTYVIVEQGDSAFFIDKHAAHERLNFDRLRSADYQPMAQQLIIPLVFTPSPQEGALLLGNLDALATFGFLCEDFGGGALVVREAPDYVDEGDIEATLLELAGKLATTGHPDTLGARDRLLATMACKAAIKGGQKNGPQELERVAEMVMSGQVKYCPHGRPIAMEITRGQLEKICKRQ